MARWTRRRRCELCGAKLPTSTEQPGSTWIYVTDDDGKFVRWILVRWICGACRRRHLDARPARHTPEAAQRWFEALDKVQFTHRLKETAHAVVPIIEQLVAIGGPEVEDRLCSLLTEEKYWRSLQIASDEPDRSAAMALVVPALVRLGGSGLLLRALLDALSHEQSNIRTCAAAVLAGIAYRSSVGQGVTAYGEGNLTDLHRKSMYLPLCSALTDESVAVRRSAVDALGHLGNRRALKPLLARIDNDDDHHVRYRAAAALGNLGDARAVEPLRRVVDDPAIAVAVQEALAKLKRRLWYRWTRR